MYIFRKQYSTVHCQNTRLLDVMSFASATCILSLRRNAYATFIQPSDTVHQTAAAAAARKVIIVLLIHTDINSAAIFPPLWGCASKTKRLSFGGIMSISQSLCWRSRTLVLRPLSRDASQNQSAHRNRPHNDPQRPQRSQRQTQFRIMER